MSRNVLLLKESAEPPSQDPYFTDLRDAGFTTQFVPVLETQLINHTELQHIIQLGSEGRFSGVIFTSQRAVDAWAGAAKALPPIPGIWQSVTFFAVGPATAQKLLRLDPNLRPQEQGIRGGTETGNGERLGQFIASILPKTSLPLLYLRGDKTTGTVVRTLTASDIAVQDLQVYATQPSDSLAMNLNVTTRNFQGGKPNWIVFFSPSSADLSVPLLRQMAILTDGVTKIAAIGPTTRDGLVQNFKMQANAVAKSPTPSSLVRALLIADTTGQC